MKKENIDSTLEPDVIAACLADSLQANPSHELRQNRPAAVLIPLIKTVDGLSLLYTRRSELVKNHKGQVSFPGGAAEPYDADEAATALREAQEEIGLPPENVCVLGQLDGIASSSRFNVTPVVGMIEKPFSLVPNPDEVARVFTVPIAWLRNPENVDFRTLETPWGRHEGVVFYKEYDGETVWGFTGLLTVRFLRIIRQFPE